MIERNYEEERKRAEAYEALARPAGAEAEPVSPDDPDAEGKEIRLRVNDDGTLEDIPRDE